MNALGVFLVPVSTEYERLIAPKVIQMLHSDPDYVVRSMAALILISFKDLQYRNEVEKAMEQEKDVTAQIEMKRLLNKFQ
jgi:hypothetical protein